MVIKIPCHFSCITVMLYKKRDIPAFVFMHLPLYNKWKAIKRFICSPLGVISIPF